jgi:hypothetical protein
MKIIKLIILMALGTTMLASAGFTYKQKGNTINAQALPVPADKTKGVNWRLYIRSFVMALGCLIVALKREQMIHNHVSIPVPLYRISYTSLPVNNLFIS